MNQEPKSNHEARPRRFEPWPLGIIAAFGAFIALTGFIVTAAVTSGMELVTKDYYEEELRYQDRMDQLRRTAPWRTSIRIALNAGELRLALPAEHAAAGVEGRLVLYRPSSAAQDVEWPLSLDGNGEQRISAATLEPGLWKAKLEWKVGSESYYFDEILVIDDFRFSDSR